MSDKLTDLQIANLFLFFKRYYNEYILNDVNEVNKLSIVNDLNYFVKNMKIKEEKNGLYPEKGKTIETILYVFLTSKNIDNKPQAKRDPTVNIKIIFENYSRSSIFSDLLYYQLLTQTITSHPNTNIRNKNDKKSSAEELLVALAIVVTIAAALLALYYISCVFISNCYERLLFNEGRGHALINLVALTMCAIGTFALALAFIVNPYSLIIAVGVGVIGAALGGYLTNAALNWHNSKSNPDALCSDDPYRYSLTASEEENLEKKGFNIIAVKCAIAALVDELPEKNVEYKLFSCRSDKTKENLAKIRDLRSGNVKEEYTIDGKERNMMIGKDMCIKLDDESYFAKFLRTPVATSIDSNLNNQSDIQVAQVIHEDNYNPLPSAPLLPKSSVI